MPGTSTLPAVGKGSSGSPSGGGPGTGPANGKGGGLPGADGSRLPRVGVGVALAAGPASAPVKAGGPGVKTAMAGGGGGGTDLPGPMKDDKRAKSPLRKGNYEAKLMAKLGALHVDGYAKKHTKTKPMPAKVRRHDHEPEKPEATTLVLFMPEGNPRLSTALPSAAPLTAFLFS